MEKSHFISMGVEELLHELLTNENVKFNGLDIQNHIRINTNNYEIGSIESLYYVLWEFMFNNVNMEYKGKTYNLPTLHRAYSNGEQLDDINFNDISVWDKELNDGFDNLYDDGEPDNFALCLTNQFYRNAKNQIQFKKTGRFDDVHLRPHTIRRTPTNRKYIEIQLSEILHFGEY